MTSNDPAARNSATPNTASPNPTSPNAAGGAAGEKTELDWRQVLSPQEYHVLREAGTERPFTGEYWDTTTEGVYSCRACGVELFASTTKFDAGCGWPSFFTPLAEDRVRYLTDETLGMKRVEVRCAACDSHLGHVFEGEGFNTPTDLRYCINSLSLTLREANA
ncbi:peptide-methionine (R)-S-oxide reductase MsrB [Glutamicibacter sp. BSL13]